MHGRVTGRDPRTRPAPRGMRPGDQESRPNALGGRRPHHPVVRGRGRSHLCGAHRHVRLRAPRGGVEGPLRLPRERTCRSSTYGWSGASRTAISPTVGDRLQGAGSVLAEFLALFAAVGATTRAVLAVLRLDLASVGALVPVVVDLTLPGVLPRIGVVSRVWSHSRCLVRGRPAWGATPTATPKISAWRGASS